MFAQTIHAAGESIKESLPPGTSAIGLGIPNEYELRELAKKLDSLAIPYVFIREDTPPFNDQYTAIGICPTLDRQKLKPILSRLKLLGNTMLGPRREEPGPENS